jgi:hypothetical protein
LTVVLNLVGMRKYGRKTSTLCQCGDVSLLFAKNRAAIFE